MARHKNERCPGDVGGCVFVHLAHMFGNVSDDLPLNLNLEGRAVPLNSIDQKMFSVSMPSTANLSYCFVIGNMIPICLTSQNKVMPSIAKRTTA